MPTSYHQLDNGCTLILQNDPCQQTVTTEVMFRVGSRDEPDGFHGLSHFAEHMFFKASKTRPKADIIAQEIDKYGGIMNAMTDYDYTGYFIKINQKYHEVALDILSDMIFNPLFRQEDIDFEKNVVGEELKIYRSNPNRRVMTLFTGLMFKGTTLEHDVGGDFPTINQATRTKFISYLHHFYRPENMVISIAGNFQKSKIVQKVKQYFDHPFQYHQSTTNKSTTNKSTTNKSTTNKSTINKSTIKFQERQLFDNFLKMQKQSRFISERFPKMENIYFTLGFPGCRYHSKDYYTCLVLAAILGGGMSSRLFSNVRERHGLVYTITSEVDAHQDVGCFTINAATSGNIERLKKTLSLILLQLKDIKDHGVTSAELEKGQNFLVGQELIQRESNSNIAHSAAYDYLMVNEKYNPDRFFKELNKVTKNNIKEIANQLFKTEKLVLSIVADTKYKKEDVLDNKLTNIL